MASQFAQPTDTWDQMDRQRGLVPSYLPFAHRLPSTITPSSDPRLASRRIAVQNHPHDQQILPQIEAQTFSLCDLHSRSRWRSAPTTSGWVPRLPHSWLLYGMHTTIRNGMQPSREAGINAVKAREKIYWATARRSGLVPILHQALTKTNERANHAPTRPQRRGQGGGIGQPAAEVCAVRE